MKHLGDVTKIDGHIAPSVHALFGGSPCQDLSVAGKRAGLDGERSGLYMEQVRIVKEMREASDGKLPKLMVWENVPGALSSKNGEDFSAVIEEVLKVIEPDIPPVKVPKGGWPNAGIVYCGKGCAAWRIHDAQYWGVPQRRRRIAMVTTFDDQVAPDLVFGKADESMSLVSDPSFKKSKKPFIALALDTTMFGVEWVDVTDTEPWRNVTERPDGVTAPLWIGDEGGGWTNVESLLSNVLEDGVDKKYYLSAKACNGILNRAKKRNKELPEELRIALETQAKAMAEADTDAEEE